MTVGQLQSSYPEPFFGLPIFIGVIIVLMASCLVSIAVVKLLNRKHKNIDNDSSILVLTFVIALSFIFALAGSNNKEITKWEENVHNHIEKTKPIEYKVVDYHVIHEETENEFVGYTNLNENLKTYSVLFLKDGEKHELILKADLEKSSETQQPTLLLTEPNLPSKEPFDRFAQFYNPVLKIPSN